MNQTLQQLKQTVRGYPTTATEIKLNPGQVSEEINRLEKNLQDVHGAIGKLAERLATVLTPQPNGPKEEPVPEPVLVPMGQTLRGLNDLACSACNRIERIIGDCEL